MPGPLTLDRLIANYIDQLAQAVGLDIDHDDRTPEGFPYFLEAVAARLAPLDQTRNALEETAANLRDLDTRTARARTRILREADSALYNAAEDLALT